MPAGVGDTVEYENFDTHGILAHLRDGKVIAWSELGKYVDFGTDGEYDTWLQRIPDLKEIHGIEYIIQVQFDYGIPRGYKTTTIHEKTFKIEVTEGVGKSVYGNVVGMTLLGRATRLEGGTLLAQSVGTSVYTKIVAIGPP